MIIPPRCYTCGKVLADKYEYYLKELIRKKQLIKNEGNDEDPLIININNDDTKKTPAGEIMDELGIIRLCCRKTFFTSIDIINEI